jgi:hypothetical protein
MRRGELLWGGLLVLLGAMFLLRTAGLIAGDVWGWFWPLAVIVFGVWILLEGLAPRRDFASLERFSVPLQAARGASLSLSHGMGHVELSAGADPGDFLTGAIGMGMNHSSRLIGDKLEVKVEAGPSFIPFVGPEGGTWRYRLNPDVPTSIKIEAGASRLDLELTDLLVSYFSFSGGAANLNLKLPARVANTLVDIEAGAATIDLAVPPGVAARIRVKGVGSLHIDEMRFPRRDGGIYQSADYDSASHRAEVNLDGGATSITIH